RRRRHTRFSRDWSSGVCSSDLGERWSDAPACTDPSLAGLARMVNDAMSDGARPSLAPLVPSVVGVTGMPPTFAGDLALLAVDHSIRVVAASHQRALAVGTLRLLDTDGATASPELRTRARAALRDVPDAHRWAARFLGRVSVPHRQSPAHALLEVAVTALAVACV